MSYIQARVDASKTIMEKQKSFPLATSCCSHRFVLYGGCRVEGKKTHGLFLLRSCVNSLHFEEASVPSGGLGSIYSTYNCLATSCLGFFGVIMLSLHPHTSVMHSSDARWACQIDGQPGDSAYVGASSISRFSSA